MGWTQRRLGAHVGRLFPRLLMSRGRQPAGGAAGAVAEIETSARLRRAPDEVLALVARRAAEVVGAQAAAVLTFTAGNNLVVRAVCGSALVDQAGVRLANVDTLAGLAAYRQRTYQCDLARRGRQYDTALADRGVRRMLYAPIPGDGRPVGVLALGHATRRRFGARQQDLAALFAGLAAATARLCPAAAVRENELERAHLARELHDSLAQSLYGISLRAQAAQELLRRDDPAEAGAPISQVVEMAASGLAETRGLISDLRPDTLDGDGLAVALGRLLETVRTVYGTAVSARLTESVPLNAPARQAVCRIAQEALQNAARHANARRVAMRLYCAVPETAPAAAAVTPPETGPALPAEAGTAETAGIERLQVVSPLPLAPPPVLLEIEDDGCGFDPDVEYPGRLGLRSMRERAEAAGGRLDVVSRPGRGTLVRAEFPPLPNPSGPDPTRSGPDPA
jgi:signal transduction histidine kinase